jgi:hypothetical protein
VKTVNRKILVIAGFVMVLATLATPMVGLVQAGKGQEKQYFELSIVGLPNYDTGEVMRTPDLENGPFAHSRDVEWLPVDVLEVTIGSNTYYPLDVGYSCVIDSDYNTVTFIGHQRVRETITFYEDSVAVGTIEILTIGKIGDEGVVFTGHGTGTFEGVKVQGTTSAEIIPWPGPPGVRLAVTRWGTVMGWP